MSLLALMVLLAAPSSSNPALSEDPFPPHRIADDLYYVGSKGLASYLVTTRKGHILINPSFPTTVPLIRANVEKLGFKITDVKIILNSHAHDDHVSGIAVAKQLTGADVFVMRGDDKVIESGGVGAGQAAVKWAPTQIKRVLEDGDKVTLGEATLVARHTPGHTRGCTTWTMKAKDAGKALDVVIVGSPNVNPNYRLTAAAAQAKDAPAHAFHYPEMVSDYEKSFALWKALPCDIFLGAHGNYYDLEAKHARLGKEAGNPFVDPGGYQRWIADREHAFRKRLAEEQGVQAKK
jgi:metallo-beta-lactamase class B